MPQPKDHAADRNLIETVLRNIPGFKGYLEREYRRESDELLRNGLAERLQRSKRSIDDLARQLVEAAQLDDLPTLDRLRSRLDRILGRIRGAMQGYSGFFDLVRIDIPLLDDVYEHDAALGQRIDAFVQAAALLPSLKDKTSAAVSDLLGQLDEIDRHWDAREELLKGLK